MKKILTFIAIVSFGAFLSNANASTYHLDNAAVDAMFAQAEVVDFNAFETMTPMVEKGYANEAFIEQKDPLTAFLLSWFLGYLGIHRAYLGTSTGTIVGYILTLGGCGIVATIDWVMLLIGVVNNDISQYVDNPRFFMW